MRYLVLISLLATSALADEPPQPPAAAHTEREYDTKKLQWEKAQARLTNVHQLNPREGLRRVDEAEQALRGYFSAKRQLYNALLEQAGGSRDRLLSTPPDTSPEQWRDQLARRREQLEKSLDKIEQARREAERGKLDPKTALKITRLDKEAELLRNNVAAVDAAYFHADRTAKQKAASARQGANTLQTTYGGLIQVYRDMLRLVDQEEKLNLEECAEIRSKLSTPTRKEDAPDKPGYSLWVSTQQQKGAQVRLTIQPDHHRVFELELEDGRRFTCKAPSNAKETNCVSDDNATQFRLRVDQKGDQIQLNWRKLTAPSADVPTQGEALLSPQR